MSGKLRAPAALSAGERTLCTLWIGGWVGPRAGLDAEARGKILCCRESNPCHPRISSWSKYVYCAVFIYRYHFQCWKLSCLKRKNTGLLVFWYKQVLLWCFKRQSLIWSTALIHSETVDLYFRGTSWRSKNAFPQCRLLYDSHLNSLSRLTKENEALLRRSSQYKYFAKRRLSDI
jgi:hypothetical protein